MSIILGSFNDDNEIDGSIDIDKPWFLTSTPFLLFYIYEIISEKISYQLNDHIYILKLI